LLVCLWVLFLTAKLAWVVRPNRRCGEQYQGALLAVFFLVALFAIACSDSSTRAPSSLSAARRGTPAGDYTLILSGRVESLIHEVAVTIRVQ